MIRQSHIIDNVNQLLNSDRVPHALLISGKMGYGPLDIALEMASALLCHNKTEGKACRQCNSCQSVLKLTHPDLHFTFPVFKRGTKKRSDITSKDFLADWREKLLETKYFDGKEWASHIGAAGKQLNINTTECNEIIKKLSLKAFDGKNKVMIIYLAEYLAKEGNRLLKLIEEPSPNSFIFLLTEDTNKILNTILSRCQVMNIPPFEDEQIKSLLVEDYHMDNTRAEEVAFLSMGNLQKANELRTSIDHSFSNQLIDWLRKAYMMDKNPTDLIEWIDDFASLDKSTQSSFVEYVLHFLRELHQSLLIDNFRSRLSKDELIVAQNIKKIIDFNKVEKLSKIMDNLYYYLGRNAHLKLEITCTSMEISSLLHLKKAS